VPYLITLPETFTPSYRKRVRAITLRPDDVWIVTYPKGGNTKNSFGPLYLTLFPKLEGFF